MFALPIFPGSRPPSIVGVHELNFCVRDGNRWTLMTINTNYVRWLFTILYVKSRLASNSMGIIAKRISLVKKKFLQGMHPQNWTLFLTLQSGLVNTWACFRSSFRLISISQLNALLHLHPWPINDIVYVEPNRDLILGRVSRLDAFSVYLVRT